ncbi:aminotransferase [Mycolicibacterium anyangense]|uniref:Aminotransferase n=2 Tax=Mycolicibacterium anyangense TaxID=1431246 RepID=A0A6N4WBZ3_9MYCO|nr:aminotransferase [Mycolicibacterium anyangense]
MLPLLSCSEWVGPALRSVDLCIGTLTASSANLLVGRLSWVFPIAEGSLGSLDMTVQRLQPYAVNIFAAMSALAARVGAVNLGQGFPDEDGPAAMLDAARQAITDGVNQYPPGPGILALRQAVAAQRLRRYGMQFDPETEVLITVGASEAIAASVLGLVEPGSDVLVIEPAFDTYAPVIAMAGCNRVTVALVPDGQGFALDVDALRAAITPRTRAVIVNSPHNPTGMVLSDTDLRALAGVAVEADLLVISDEVYEHLVYDDTRHLPIATYPGMAARTVTISSAAKMFNCTGWKIGWACGATDLIAGVRAAKQYLSYVGGAPFQPAVAYALNTEDAWVDALRDSLQVKRDALAGALTDIGFAVHDSAGTYFLCADPRPLGFSDSAAFCAELPTRAGVAAIPMSAFCDPHSGHAEKWNHLVRFAFCKRQETLDEAIRRLAVLRA